MNIMRHFLLFLSIILLFSCNVDEKRINKAKQFIENNEFENAKNSLQFINYSSDYYIEKQKLIGKIDSLELVKIDSIFFDKIEKHIQDENFHYAIKTLHHRDTLNDYYKSTIKRIDSIEVAKERLVIKNIINKFKSEIEDLNKKNDYEKYNGNINLILNGVAFFDNYNDIISENRNNKNKEIRRLSNKLKNKLITLQKREFPKLRKRYVNVASEKLWEEDVYIHSSGRNNTYINFTGGIFASNKNIKNYQEKLYDILAKLKFKKSKYRWYKGGDYTYYELHNSDSDLD